MGQIIPFAAVRGDNGSWLCLPLMEVIALDALVTEPSRPGWCDSLLRGS